MKLKADDSSSSGTFPKGLSQPATRALNVAGYTRLEQLSGVNEAELAKLHGISPKALRIIKQALVDDGLAPLKP